MNNNVYILSNSPEKSLKGGHIYKYLYISPADRTCWVRTTDEYEPSDFDMLMIVARLDDNCDVERALLMLSNCYGQYKLQKILEGYDRFYAGRIHGRLNSNAITELMCLLAELELCKYTV